MTGLWLVGFIAAALIIGIWLGFKFAYASALLDVVTKEQDAREHTRDELVNDAAEDEL